MEGGKDRWIAINGRMDDGHGGIDNWMTAMEGKKWMDNNGGREEWLDGHRGGD